MRGLSLQLLFVQLKKKKKFFRPEFIKVAKHWTFQEAERTLGRWRKAGEFLSNLANIKTIDEFICKLTKTDKNGKTVPISIDFDFGDEKRTLNWSHVKVGEWVSRKKKDGKMEKIFLEKNHLALHDEGLAK